MPQQPTPACRIAILGGGITGLTALYELTRARRNGVPVEPFLLEASGRLGGLVRTERVGEFLVEGGPDSFLTEKGEGLALARELGLDHNLIGSNDAQRRTYILHRNRPVPLPPDWQLFVPRGVWSALLSGLLPISTRLAIVSEALRPQRFKKGNRADESVAAFVRRHFGRGMLESIAEPLLAAIYGGDTEQLSAPSVLPRLYALERQYGSLTRGVAKANANRKHLQPTFTTLRDGMEQLVESLVAQTGDCPRACFHLGFRAAAIKMHGPWVTIPPLPRYSIQSQNGKCFEADAVILSVPAFECANLLRSIDEGLARELESIPYTPAVLVALGYSVRPAELPEGFGFLVPGSARRRLLACTFVHTKFPFRTPNGAALLRCFLGGARNPNAVQMSEGDLSSQVVEELREILSIRVRPAFSRVYRWPFAMPQYVTGHEERVGRIWAAAENIPGLFLAGNAYSGVGLSDSIRTARAAAEKAVAFARASRG